MVQKPKLFLLCFSIALHGLFLSAPLHAAEAAETHQVITITASRQETSLNNISTSLSVLDQQQLQLIGQVHINQAFSRIPGSWISRGNGQEHLTAIRSPVLTGAGACAAFFMAEDGISLRAPGFCNVNQLFDANTEQAETIEVIRGPASVLFGSNAVHGVINIMSPDLFEPHSDQVALEIGPYDYLRSRVQFSKVEQHHAFGAYANFTRDGGYQQASGFDQQKLNTIHQYQAENFSSKTMLSLTNINQNTAGFIEGEQAYKDKSLRRTNPNPEAYRDSQSWRIYSKLNWDLGQPKRVQRSRFSITPYLRNNQMEFIQHFVPWKPIEKTSQQSVGIKTLYSQINADWSWHSGIDAEHTQATLMETQAEDFSATIPQGVHYDYEVRSHIFSTFMDVNWRVFESSEINAGVRFDQTSYDYQNHLSDGSACAAMITNCRFSRPQDQTRRFNHWSSRIGWLYQLDSHNRVYSELSQGFRAPQATELFRLQAGQLISDLDTEELASLQIGMRGTVADLIYDFSLYQMQKQHFIFQDSQRQVVSNGETSHAGFELALTYPIHRNWKIDFSSSHANHRYDNNIQISNSNIQNNQIDTAPKQLSDLRLSWLPSDSTTWELELVHLGRYYLNPQNSAVYPGHNLAHLRGRFEISSNLTLSLRLNNLTNRLYAERADYAFASYRYFVGQPRSLFLNLTYQLND